MILIYNLLLFLIIPVTKIVESQGGFYNEEENINERENNEKIYFPGKTNENEMNLKRFKNALATNCITKTNSNYIDDESEEHQQSTSSRSRVLSTIIINIDINLMNENSSSSTSEETDEKRNKTDSWNQIITNLVNTENEARKNKSSSSSRKIISKLNERIPPPSFMASASAKSTLRVCEIKYAEYIQRIFPHEFDTASDANDALYNGRILAAPGEYPHMTALGFPSTNGKTDYKCGGSLISENFVITAAHCTNFTGLLPTKVRIGDLNLMIEESYLEPQIRNIKKIHVHPDYNTTSYYNDIALLELEEDVQLTEFVRPIRLWTEETLPFTTAYAMGYGATAFARQRTNRLTNLNMTIVPNEKCNCVMLKFSQSAMGILPSQICAKDYVLNRDTCQGDSGGPLQFNIRGRRSKNRLHYQLIGITSYGLFCRSGLPSIFTRVCFYLDWIEHIVWKDYFA